MNTKEVWNRFREIGMPQIASISLVYILSLISLLLSTSEAQTSGTWMQTGSMNTGRYAIRAIELGNGKVLVTGGIGASSTVLTSAELYDPTTGNWSPTGSMNKGRAYYTAALLRNGQVLSLAVALTLIVQRPRTPQKFMIRTPGCGETREDVNPEIFL